MINKMNKDNNRDSSNNISNKIINRKRMTVIGTIVIGFLFTFFVENGFYNDLVAEYEKSMKAAVAYGRVEYNDNLNKSDIYMRSCKDAMADIAAYTAFAYEELQYSIVTRAELVNDVGEFATYYYYKGGYDEETGTLTGQMFSEARGYELPALTDAEFITLFKEGFYEYDEETFLTSAPVSTEGYVILVWGVEDILKKQSVLAAYSNNNEESIMRINTETGIIEDAMDESLVGTDSDRYVSVEELRAIEPYSISTVTVANGNKVVIYRDEEEDGQIVTSFMWNADLIPEVIRGTAIPVILGWLFLWVIAAYMLRFSYKRNDDEREIKYTRIFRKLYVNSTFMQHIVSLSSFAIILIIVSLVYFQTLINLSEQNIKANHSLQTLDYVETLNEENAKLIKDDYLSIRTILINDISNFFMRHQDRLSNETLTRLCSKLPNTSSIAFYNSNGDVQYDTKGMEGYTLGKDETMPEYVCWDILNGKSDSVCYVSNTVGYEEAHIAARRQDKPGLILIEQESPYIDEFDRISTLEHEIRTSYFGSAAKGYIWQDDLKKLHWISANSNDISDISNTLTEVAMTNGYAGVVRIGGVRYYVNTRSNDDKGYILIAARPFKELYGLYSYFVLLEIFAAFVLQQMMILALSGHRLNSSIDNKIEISRYGFIHQTLDEQMMDARFRKVIAYMFFETCGMVVFVLVFDSFFGKTSLLAYLFASEWSKGVNLFSVTMILIMAAIVTICGYLLQLFITFFTKNMGPRGVTIGLMSNSLIKFGILVVIAINIMLDLGMKSSTLLAGAGVFGVAFSLFAQQTLSDFLCGFFIVFEGAYNIGDWVTFDDFRGQVVEISVRTTKIAKGDNVLIVNNSELKKVMLMAKNGTGARVFFDIAYKEDADNVISLIKQNTERYKEEISSLCEGPFVDGVVGLGDSGVSIRMWALSENQSATDAVEREMLRVTKKILDENGIEIPFTQVTIHTAED